MAKYSYQEHVIYSGEQYPDYAGVRGEVTDTRETQRGVMYLVALDNGAQVLLPEEDLSLPETPAETQEAAPAEATETPDAEAEAPEAPAQDAPVEAV